MVRTSIISDTSVCGVIVYLDSSFLSLIPRVVWARPLVTLRYNMPSEVRAQIFRGPESWMLSCGLHVHKRPSSPRHAYREGAELIRGMPNTRSKADTSGLLATSPEHSILSQFPYVFPSAQELQLVCTLSDAKCYKS